MSALSATRLTSLTKYFILSKTNRVKAHRTCSRIKPRALTHFLTYFYSEKYVFKPFTAPKIFICQFRLMYLSQLQITIAIKNI